MTPPPRSRRRLLSSSLEAIGDTPLIALDRITRLLEGRILAKLECLNPGYSKKDRIARRIVEEAEAEGELPPGRPVVELTSGNTGTGAAIVCAVQGRPFIAVMSARQLAGARAHDGGAGRRSGSGGPG